MRWFQALGLLLLISLWSAMLLKLNIFAPGFGMVSLLFVVSLALVGEGRRLLWSAVFPVLSCLLSGASALLLAAVPDTLGLLRPLLMFTLVTVLPATLLWLAVKFKGRRVARQAA